ncbi:hypothetical protein E2C01_021262 [Portunus trituberculatus]|uniref:Uncharacterized protein n=1 Tax=Portunus trituberculatus TaxID=210409 RepID=A0A5B7E2S8_PORTR|nr:hypothetical protein [Portunus trituberculatus]
MNDKIEEDLMHSDVVKYGERVNANYISTKPAVVDIAVDDDDDDDDVGGDSVVVVVHRRGW